MIIRASNLLSSVAPFTFLSTSAGTGAGTFQVQNANPFTASWAIQIGQTGESQSEILVLGTGTPSGTQLVTTANSTFAHPIDTPVYAIKYDQIIWKRSTSGTGGVASAIATTSITPSEQTTDYDDQTGATTYAYKTAFYNSVTGSSSSDSDWLTPSGYSFYSLAAIRQRIKDKLFSSAYIGDDSVIDNWINEYLEMMTNTAIDVNEDYNLGSTTVTFASGGELGTITNTDFKQIRRMWMTQDGSTYYPATKMDAITPAPNQVYNATLPYFFMLGDNVISRWPHDTGGTASILYYKLNPVLVNETDALPVSMYGYTKGFVDYGLAQAKAKDGKPDEAAKLEASAFAMMDRFKREITPRNKTGQTVMTIVESVSEDIGEFWN